MKTGFKIIAITPEGFINNETTMLIKLFASGLTTLHIRKPRATKKELINFLGEIPKEHRKKIVLHSHYELIKEFKLKGAHLTSRSRTDAKAINWLRRNKIKIVSTSFHSEEEINLYRRKYEYAFLSPVFDSISKTNYKSNFKLETLNPLLKKKKNIVALGGITADNIEEAKRAGFCGAAVLGYLWNNKNPDKHYKELVSKIQ